MSTVTANNKEPFVLVHGNLFVISVLYDFKNYCFCVLLLFRLLTSRLISNLVSVKPKYVVFLRGYINVDLFVDLRQLDFKVMFKNIDTPFFNLKKYSLTDFGLVKILQTWKIVE